jgi:O-antigen ligase
MPLHPHNAGLQILLELGVPGVVLALVLLWILAARLERLRGPPRVCGQALFVATLAIASTAYGIWQNQWLALILSAALLIPLTFQASAQPKALRDAAPGRAQPAD